MSPSVAGVTPACAGQSPVTASLYRDKARDGSRDVVSLSLYLSLCAWRCTRGKVRAFKKHFDRKINMDLHFLCDLNKGLLSLGVHCFI